MAQVVINFDEIRTHKTALISAVAEAEAGVKQLDSLMQQLCEKNETPALKRQSDSLTETITSFIKAILAEMESVTGMTDKAENLAAVSS